MSLAHSLSALIRELSLKLVMTLLCAAENINQNSLLEYLMTYDIAREIFQVQSHAFEDRFIVLTLFVALLS